MDFLKLNFIFFIEVELIYSAVPMSAVQQSDSVIHIQTFFFYTLFHYGLSQGIEYSSLGYTVGLRYLWEYLLLFNFKIFIYLFNFWLRWVFVAARGLSLVVASRSYSLLQCAGFPLQ